MKDGIDNFIELLVSGDFFLIFLIIIMLVVMCTIFYLIKQQINDGKTVQKDEDILPVSNKPTIEVKEPIKEEIKEPIKEEVKTYDDEITKFESDQEEMAIISTNELYDKINTMKETGAYQVHEQEIEKYEAEQENKAIISYDELLKRASADTIKYESEETIGGIRVSKVDTTTIETKEENNKAYYEEESFLRALKDFRGALE